MKPLILGGTVFLGRHVVEAALAPGCVYDERAPLTPSLEGYGGSKARAKEVIQMEFPARVTVLRPGLIVGPHDPTGRFTYWPLRLAGPFHRRARRSRSHCWRWVLGW